MKPFKGFNTSQQPGGSTTLDRTVQAARATFDSLKNAVTNDVIVAVALTGTTTNVYHGLGQIPTTWELVDIDAQQIVWRAGAATTQFIPLRASGNCNVRIRFT